VDPSILGGISRPEDLRKLHNKINPPGDILIIKPPGPAYSKINPPRGCLYITNVIEVLE